MEKEISLSQISKLNEAVSNAYGFDFTNYAMSSFKRRVTRYMAVEKIPGVHELIEKVVSNKRFFDHFLTEITVNTTEMFRDPTMWITLRDEVIPSLLYKKQVRVWHVGCSSGEEVYSLVILLEELGVRSKFSVVATDINEEVIEVAKNGLYPARNLDTNHSNYLKSGGNSTFSNYYKTTGDGLKVQMNSDLISNVKFYKHNLIIDKDFGKFDLILCRNVLIYFDKFLQDKVFQLMLNSLNPLGYLILGSKESMVWSTTYDKYNTISDKSKVFRLKEV
ncbi:protein-glutamate O-methyltransferase CheR [Paracrocinitomix mangrovi]|uniref:CheR family methyltransferase n=1 Tax=Paracrocinitomix mangrovi TaxID=2862509 RepID=UPI001C8DD5C8|nr:protein-glutamate O-methyltransferase CheR [Paracrocinitomix mangrovi]UKN01614.1 protein-glutamate O-methyltransferase CheR [Paracrocinitomix mangrovi]